MLIKMYISKRLKEKYKSSIRIIKTYVNGFEYTEYETEIIEYVT